MSKVVRIKRRKGERVTEFVRRAASDEVEEPAPEPADDEQELQNLEAQGAGADDLDVRGSRDHWEMSALNLAGTREEIKTLKGAEDELKRGVLEAWPVADRTCVIPDADGTIVTVTMVKPDDGHELDVGDLLENLTEEQIDAVMVKQFSYEQLKAAVAAGIIDQDEVKRHTYAKPKNPYVKTSRRRP